MSPLTARPASNPRISAPLILIANVPSGKLPDARSPIAPSTTNRRIEPSPPSNATPIHTGALTDAPTATIPTFSYEHPRAAHGRGREPDRDVPGGDARSRVRDREPVAIAFDHRDDLHLHRRESGVRAAEPRAEQRPAVSGLRQALLQAGGEVPKRERAADVDRENRPRPARGRGTEVLAQPHPRQRADSTPEEDRGKLASIEARHRLAHVCRVTLAW